MAAKMYGLFLKSMANKELNLNTDSIKAMLCTSAYAPNQDTDQYKLAVTSEVVGAGYTAGGVAVTGVSVTYTAATNVLALFVTVPAWAASTITARYLVLYDATPATDATRPLIMYDDFVSDQVSSAGSFTYTANAGGIATITAA